MEDAQKTSSIMARIPVAETAFLFATKSRILDESIITFSFT